MLSAFVKLALGTAVNVNERVTCEMANGNRANLSLHGLCEKLNNC